MTTPNLDATWHCWIESLLRFTFSIEHQRRWDNAATDALGRVTLKLDAESMKSIPETDTVGMIGKSRSHDPVVVEADEEIHKQVLENAVLARAAHACVNLHVTEWVTAQQEDPILKTMIEWISNCKVQDLKHMLEDDENTWEGKRLSFESRKNWCSNKEHCTITTHWLVSWKKFCGLWSPWLIKLLPWMDVIDMLDTRISSKPCAYYRTSSGGPAWPCRCRKQLVTANDVSNMRALMLKHQCSPSLPLVLWSCYM